MSRKSPKKNTRPLYRPIPCGSCNRPTPAGEPGAGITLMKRSRQTEAPLPGAEFRIVQNGRIVATAISDINGRAHFPALTPGAYQLWEVKAPMGHVTSGSGLSLVVAPDGRVTAEGAAADTITLYNSPIATEPDTPTATAPIPTGENSNEAAPESAPPTSAATCAAPDIDPILSGAAAVTGSGMDGARITLRFPGGAEASTTVFGGQWYIFVPASVTLSPGDRLEAVQTCAGVPSDPAFAAVI